MALDLTEGVPLLFSFIFIFSSSWLILIGFGGNKEDIFSWFLDRIFMIPSSHAIRFKKKRRNVTNILTGFLLFILGILSFLLALPSSLHNIVFH